MGRRILGRCAEPPVECTPLVIDASVVKYRGGPTILREVGDNLFWSRVVLAQLQPRESRRDAVLAADPIGADRAGARMSESALVHEQHYPIRLRTAHAP